MHRAYARALTLGQTAQEYEPDEKAVEETTKLFKWLYDELTRKKA
jgi:hypothetical protein